LGECRPRRQQAQGVHRDARLGRAAYVEFCDDEKWAAAITRKFREMFADDLAAMKEVFPALPVEIGEDGITLRPCDPADVFAVGRRRIT
jgi:hypothetical protein